MGAGYSSSAFDYNKDDMEIDPDTKMKFVPNQKELELFKKEKMNLYKGTWTVCFVYGISALILLITILFTETGRTYIYDKYLPAVITYVVGAIIIILYLIYSIFNIKPRKLGKAERMVHSCPDYWKYEVETDNDKKTAMIKNVNEFSNRDLSDPSCATSPNTCVKQGDKTKQYILTGDEDPELNNGSSNLYINYKCIPDTYIYGGTDNHKGFLNEYNNKYLKTAEDKYIYTELNNDKNIDTLMKYAQTTGIYKKEFTNTNEIIYNGSGSFDIPQIQKTPLICNELYPVLISKLEKTPDDTDVRCAYAKKCGVSWSDIDCYKK